MICSVSEVPDRGGVPDHEYRPLARLVQVREPLVPAGGKDAPQALDVIAELRPVEAHGLEAIAGAVGLEGVVMSAFGIEEVTELKGQPLASAGRQGPRRAIRSRTNRIPSPARPR